MHAIGIQLPATDLHRAKHFYETVFGHAPTDVLEEDGRVRTVIDGSPGVFLNQTPGFTPADGSLPYFHVDDLDAAVSAVTASDGTVVQPPARSRCEAIKENARLRTGMLGGGIHPAGGS